MFNIRRYLTAGIVFRLLIIAAGFLITNEAMAATSIALSTIAGNMSKSVSSIAGMLEDVALVCGVGFILASFFKFHQHKLNPTQVPMSQGVTLLVIGAGLSIFPHLLNTVSKSAFDTGVDKFGGTAMRTLLGT